MAEAAAAIEVLWIPSLAPRYDRDAFLRTDPRANPTPSASIEVEEVPSSVALFNRVSLLWKSQGIRSVKEMTDTC